MIHGALQGKSHCAMAFNPIFVSRAEVIHHLILFSSAMVIQSLQGVIPPTGQALAQYTVA